MNDFDGVSEEEADGKIFQPGQEILITTEDGFAAGFFVGLADFGVVYRATHRMAEIADSVSVKSINALHVTMSTKTKAELKEFAEEELDMEFGGKVTKKEMVEEIVAAMVSDAEEGLQKRKEFVELRRTIMTFLPWQEIREIQSSDEYLEERDLQNFSDALDMGLIIDDKDGIVFPGS